MRALLALLLVAGPVAAQDAVDDKDFTFTMTLPPGLARLTDAQVAEMQGKSLDEVVNVPRSESESGQTAHSYYWDDAAGRGREASLLLADGPAPFGDPDQLTQAMEQEMGMKVDFKEPLRAPNLPGVRIEGVRTSKTGTELRATIAYFILAGEPNVRWALLRLQAPAADWEACKTEVLESIASVKFPIPKQQGGGAAPGATTRRRAQPGEVEPWTTLEVTGSLVLAAVLLMSLFFGGRSHP